jgi:Sulfotransferase family
MIVSHKYRFIFLKTRKTAGTSIELTLSNLAGADAIVTPIFPPEEEHEPRNYKGGWTDIPQWARANPHGSARSLVRLATSPRGNHLRGYYNHMPAWLVRARLGEEIWNTYFKFCFERNPWDKVVSLYWWTTRNLDRRPSFDDWLYSDSRVASDWFLYSLAGECAVDRVGQYETLTSDMREILGHIGVSVGDFELPRAKSGHRSKRVKYSPEGLDYVERLFQHEIEMFGYECPLELRA